MIMTVVAELLDHLWMRMQWLDVRGKAPPVTSLI